MTVSYSRALSELSLGYEPASLSTSAIVQALNGATNYVAYGFTPTVTDTIDTVDIFVNSKTGSPVASDIVCELYSDVSGGLGSLIGTGSPLAATPATGWVRFSSFSGASVTAGTPVFFRVKNVNATPASDYITVGYSATLEAVYGNSTLYGPRVIKFDGTTTTTSVSAASFCAHYATADKWFGFPAAIPAALPSGERITGTTEIGVKLTMPIGATCNTKRIAMPWYKSATPTGNLGLKVYDSGGSLLYTSIAVPLANIDTAQKWTTFNFSSSFSLVGNTTYYFMAYDTNASETSTNFFTGNKIPFNPDATAGRPLKPFDGTMVMVKNVAGTFTDVTDYILPIAIFLEGGNEFSASAGGGPTSAMYCG